jgi:hypothetical protein
VVARHPVYFMWLFFVLFLFSFYKEHFYYITSTVRRLQSRKRDQKLATLCDKTKFKK